MIEGFLSSSAIGTPARVAEAVAAFVDRTKADELMVTSQIFDFEARKRSYTLLAEATAQQRLAA